MLGSGAGAAGAAGEGDGMSLEPLRHWSGVSGLWIGTLGGALGHLGAMAVGFAAAAVVVAWCVVEDRTRG
jgi:hypothetical protein